MQGIFNLSGTSGGGGGGLAPKDVSNLAIQEGNSKVILTWNDPEDTVVEGITLSTWKGTKVVYKEGSFPTGPNDGIVAVNNEERNKYATNGLVVTGLTNNTTYYFQLFPYSTENVYNKNNVNRITGMPQTLPPDNVTGIAVRAGDGKLTVSWTDPADKTVNGVQVNWGGTKLVYKTGGYPVSVDDGTLAVNSQVRDQYATSGFEITGLTNDETYYIQLFPYSTDGAINTDEANRATGVPQPYKIYGIKRSLTTSSPAWERTDDAVGLVANAQVGTDPVVNNFDSLYPWSDIYTYSWNKDTGEETRYDAAGFSYTDDYIFTKIPTLWYKRWQDSTHEYIQIATAELEGFTKCDAFSVGRYTMSGSTSAPTSKSGVAPLVSQTRASFRTAAAKLSGCCLIDWRYFILQMLYLVEYADYDSQTKLGQGWTSSNSSAINNGSCDALGMKSGRPTGTDGKTGVIYRGVENIFGNIWQWVDGINISSRKAYVCTDPTKYADNTTSGDYVGLSYTNASSDGYASKLGYDANRSIYAFPTAASGSQTTYMCDYYYQYSGSYVAAVGGAWNSGLWAGLFCWLLTYSSSYADACLGSRLLKYQ